MIFFGLSRGYRKGEYVKCTNDILADQWTAYLTRGKVVEDTGRSIRVKVLDRGNGLLDMGSIWWMQRQFLRPIHDDRCCDVDTSLFEQEIAMEIIVHPDITEDVSEYVEEIKKNNPDKVLKKVEISPADDGESVKVKYTFDSVGFERIRRITGYLVGTLDRFNDAKRAEVEDRVKHL